MFTCTETNNRTCGIFYTKITIKITDAGTIYTCENDTLNRALD